MIAVKNPKDICLGLLYLAIGSIGLFVGRDYSMGSGGNMGPGYFPFYISILLVAIGLISMTRSLVLPGVAIERLRWKPTLLIALSIVSFAVLIERAGILIALPLTMLIAASASERFDVSLKPIAGLAGFVAACVAVFVFGLGLPLPLIGSWFE